jgi:hypothetical protein
LTWVGTFATGDSAVTDVAATADRAAAADRTTLTDDSAGRRAPCSVLAASILATAGIPGVGLPLLLGVSDRVVAASKKQEGRAETQ